MEKLEIMLNQLLRLVWACRGHWQTSAAFAVLISHSWGKGTEFPLPPECPGHRYRPSTISAVLAILGSKTGPGLLCLCSSFQRLGSLPVFGQSMFHLCPGVIKNCIIFGLKPLPNLSVRMTCIWVSMIGLYLAPSLKFYTLGTTCWDNTKVYYPYITAWFIMHVSLAWSCTVTVIATELHFCRQNSFKKFT